MDHRHVITDQRSAPVSAALAIVVAVLSLGYMAPWAVAAVRGKRNHWTIFWVNLLLGWSVIGWVIALVMSLNNHNIIGVDVRR